MEIQFPDCMRVKRPGFVQRASETAAADPGKLNSGLNIELNREHGKRRQTDYWSGAFGCFCIYEVWIWTW